jgi:hypothetical protein
MEILALQQMSDWKTAELVGYWHGLRKVRDMRTNLSSYLDTKTEIDAAAVALRRLHAKIQTEMDYTEAKLPPGTIERWPLDGDTGNDD